MSSESPFVETRQRNRTFSPPVTDPSVSACTEGCFHFSAFDTRAHQKMVMDVMGRDDLHRCSEESRDVNQRGETKTEFAIQMLICFTVRRLLSSRADFYSVVETLCCELHIGMLAVPCERAVANVYCAPKRECES